MSKQIALAFILSLTTYSQLANADEFGKGPVSIGLQMAPLTFGLSVRYATSENWKWQAVLSPAEAENISYTLRTLRTTCLLYTSPSPRDATLSRMPSSA